MSLLRELIVDTTTKEYSSTKLYALVFSIFTLVLECILVYRGIAGAEIVYANMVFISSLLGLKGALRAYEKSKTNCHENKQV